MVDNMDKRITAFVESLDKDIILYIALYGSYANNRQTRFSDADIKIVLKEGQYEFKAGYRGDLYFAVTYETEETMKRYFTDPLEYLNLRSTFDTMVLLYDSNQHYEAFRNQFMSIRYESHFAKESKEYVNRLLVEWFEEINKSISGLHFNNPDKLIAGLHGLSYGMLNVLAVSEGIPFDSLGFLKTFQNYFHDDDRYRYGEILFGVEPHSLESRTIYGLKLFQEICSIIKHNLSENTLEQLAIIDDSVIETIERFKDLF